MSVLKGSALLLLACLVSLVAVYKIHRPSSVVSSVAWWLWYMSLLTFCALRGQESVKYEAREPVRVAGFVPYVGHLIGILRYGSQYFKELGRKHCYPIFTLPMPGSPLYIITDPSLASSAQRATKALSFSPLVPAILQRVAGFDQATINLMKGDMEHGYIQQVQEAVHTRLGQGQYLDEVTLKACNEFLHRLYTFAGDHPGGEEVEFCAWMKHLVTIATSTFFYGPNNPVERNGHLVQDFWDFDAGIPGLLLGMLPAITARKAYRGREAIVHALADYLDSPQYEEAAEITQKRSEIGRKFGVDTENVARSDLTFFFAGIINTSLTSFWMVLNIFNRPQLLASIRSELDSVLSPFTDDADVTELSIKDLVKKCTLLYAVFREVLRLYSDNFATRVVLEDTLLADRYFLRKHSIVQVSGGIIHGDNRIWGSDVAEFRPERHLESSNKGSAHHENQNEQSKSIHPAAFRAFGGGATLCPGRHFALNEIMALVAMIVLLFDVTGVDGGTFRVPSKKDDVLPIHVLEPTDHVKLMVKRRPEWQGKTLRLRQ